MSGVPSPPPPVAPASSAAPAAGVPPVAVPVADGTAVAVPDKLRGLTRAVAVPGTVTGTGDNGLTVVRTAAGDLTLRLSEPPPTDRPVTVQLAPGQPMRATVLATPQPGPLPLPTPGSAAATLLSQPPAEPPATQARPPDTVATPQLPPTLPPTLPGSVVPAQVVAATPLASLIAGAAGLALPGAAPAVRPQSLSEPGVLARLVERLFAEYDQTYGAPAEPEGMPATPQAPASAKETSAPAKNAAATPAPTATPRESVAKTAPGESAEPAKETAPAPATPTAKVSPTSDRPVPMVEPRPVPTQSAAEPPPSTPESAKPPIVSLRTPSTETPSPVQPALVKPEGGTEQSRPVAATPQPETKAPAPDTPRTAATPLPSPPVPADAKAQLPNAAAQTGARVPDPPSPAPQAAPANIPAPVPGTDAEPAPQPATTTTKPDIPAKPDVPRPTPPLLTQGGTVGLRIVSVTPPNQPPPTEPAPDPSIPPPPDGEPQITGIVGGTTQRGQPVLVTASGSLILNTRTPLEKGTVVTAALVPDAAPLPLDTVAPDPIRLMTAGAELPEMRAMLAALSGVDRGIAAQVAATLLPQPNRKLGAALTFLLGALRGGDARGWLGEDAATALDKAGRGEVVSRFEREFRAANRESADSTQTEWRSYTLPMLDSSGLAPIRVHVHAVGEEERRKRERGESEPRSHFLVDLSLSRLGPLQLDGLVRQKRFDLVLRSHAPLSEGLRAELTRVFTDSVTAVGFTGGIGFQAGGKSWVVPAPRAEAGKGVTA